MNSKNTAKTETGHISTSEKKVNQQTLRQLYALWIYFHKQLGLLQNFDLNNENLMTVRV